MLRILINLTKWTVIILSIGIIPLALVAPFYIYSNFNQEEPIALLQFQKINHQHYSARITSGETCMPEEYEIFGDQWQLDASFLKWKSVGVLLGWKPLYKLDRLTGRYRSTEDQNSKKKYSHNLAPEVLFDFFNDQELNGSGSFLADTIYGSSVYTDIAIDKLYVVYRTEDGLIVKSKDKPSTLSINKTPNEACKSDKSLLDHLAGIVNKLAVIALKENKTQMAN